jgi:hypothetical protein
MRMRLRATRPGLASAVVDLLLRDGVFSSILALLTLLPLILAHVG